MIFIFALYDMGLTGLWLNAPLTMAACCIMSLVILIVFSREMKKKETETPNIIE
jgi:Na+-driven multidrug efflux pump